MSSVMTRRKKGKSKKDKKKEIAPLLPVETHGYKRYKNDRRMEEPFLVTNMKVGGVLAVLIIFIYEMNAIFTSHGSGIGMPSADSEGVWSKYVTDDAVGGGEGEGEGGDLDTKSKVFPTFDLDDYEGSRYDAWGIEERFLQDQKIRNKSKKRNSFLEAAAEIREQFALMYGGEDAARALLSLGLSTFEPQSKENPLQIPEGIRYTAKRILDAMKGNKVMKISFAGGGAVSGRGNYYDESFPSVLAQILMDPFEKLGITLEVRNAAIADIGSFPYGFCLNNFLGFDADVVSFDPEMISRGDNTAAFEAYLRNAISMEHSPMLLMRETSYTETRRDLIQKYVDLGTMSDPLIFNVEAARAPFNNLDDSILPPGFQDWMEFSGPGASPGKTRSNIPKAQHDLIGRMLSMYFLAAAELAIAQDLGLDNLPKGSLDVGPTSKSSYRHYYLPPPQSDDSEKSKNITMLYGSKIPGDQKWYMNEVHCRTSFDPTIYGELDDIIVSGTDAEDIDLLRPRGPMLYNKNWVLDMGSVGKQLANSLEQYNFGYQDRRKGYFGIRPSGNLTMFIPYELNDSVTKYEQLEGKKPNEMFKSVVVCQVNERANCQVDKDISFVLGGKQSQPHLLEANGVSYLGRKHCVSLDIPDSATWSKKEMEGSDTGGWLRSSAKEASGLSLNIFVSNELLFWKDGPCSVSHVIWEQFRDLK